MMVSASVERAMAWRGLPVRPGVLVIVVGPSGAGKDTLIDGVRDSFALADDVMFVRRVVTRPADAAAEDHETLSEADFAAAEDAGEFAMTWRAHGLSYGLPVAVDEHIRGGNVAVANGSRGALDRLAERYQNLVVINVTASPDILANRLAERGRESREAILSRLNRSEKVGLSGSLSKAVTIDNSGSVSDGIDRLEAEIRKALAFAAISETI